MRALRLLFVSTALVMAGACGPEPAPNMPPELPPVDAPFAPVVKISRPSESVRVAPGVPVVVEWTTHDSDSTPITDIFADRDGDLGTTLDQFILAASLPSTGAVQSATWDTTGAALGTYGIIARAWDGDAAVMVKASATVELTPPQLNVTNLAPNELLRYRLALLAGTTEPGITSVSVSNDGAPARSWPASGGHFKALIPLKEGQNPVTLVANDVQHQFTLQYVDADNPRFVRLIYVLAADGDGKFDAPAGEPNDVASAKGRIAVAAELMQTFTAEKLNSEGLGRRTFRIPRDASGEPIVETFTSTLTLAQARAMDGGALWSHFYGELGSLPQRGESIDVVLMSMTKYDPVQKVALAHTALGGGRLGLFGSGTLHTWAQTLDEVVPRLSDDRAIDTNELLDDSAYRGRHWANYSTGVGATLHELGHCLSLPHPANGKGVMSREFDHFNRAFMVREPESDVSPVIDPVLPANEIGWDRSAAVRLRFHRWLEPDGITFTSNVAPSISQTSTSVSASSASGLRHVAWSVNGDVAGHEEFLEEAPPSFMTTKAALKSRFPGATSLHVSVIDAQGNIGQADVQLP